ncbi:hypothetical protein K450DRAFT_252023 [Umbelopsis ramanniana AG]|uniref:SET domain-containing protein n=1 Tax=Umbelopsis ramanniana AG TaxID=1314678 RepID=A0AAD5E8E3_UMBRA|nr:uncharacterized protein K450DRAFT_252023 [Umbelopsis ramanniana AG]KAI8577510.1 hypothetical protein K450DRAFT_252023 [Umbelopsis ramanniana AG]
MCPIQVTTIRGRGRAYCATASIAKGETVLTSSPIAAIVSQEWLPETCLWCFYCSYPRRNKVRAIAHQDIKRRKTPFEGAGFCSDSCKELAVTSNYAGEWEIVQKAYLALDHEYRAREQHEGIATPAASEVDVEDYFGGHVDADISETEEATDINDSVKLKEYIDRVWNLATRDSALLANTESFVPESERVDMCKLIATCLIRNYYSENSISDPSIQNFDSLMHMQYNEVTRFQDLYRKMEVAGSTMTIPATALQSFEEASKYVPEDIMQDIQLYLFFSAAFEKKDIDIPWAFNHTLFRHVLYREMSNSFGIWDPSEGSDQELLGWALHPKAVYFNHSCEPNIRKVRQGRNMVFIAEQNIEQGDELCIAYGSVAEPVDERRNRLFDNYSFWCQCSRCTRESA